MGQNWDGLPQYSRGPAFQRRSKYSAESLLLQTQSSSPQPGAAQQALSPAPDPLCTPPCFPTRIESGEENPPSVNLGNSQKPKAWSKESNSSLGQVKGGGREWPWEVHSSREVCTQHERPNQQPLCGPR